MLKGHGNEADFRGFLQNWFLMSPLQYLSSRSDLSFKFFIKKRHPDSPSWGVDKMPIYTNFVKPLNKSMVVVHNIPGLIFAKLVLERAGLAV